MPERTPVLSVRLPCWRFQNATAWWEIWGHQDSILTDKAGIWNLIKKHSKRINFYRSSIKAWRLQWLIISPLAFSFSTPRISSTGLSSFSDPICEADRSCLLSIQSSSVILIASQRELLLSSWHSEVFNVTCKYFSLHSPYVNDSMSFLHRTYSPDSSYHPTYILSLLKMFLQPV